MMKLVLPMRCCYLYLSGRFSILIPLFPYQIWKIFFIGTMLQEVVEQTALYVQREKNDKEFEIMTTIQALYKYSLAVWLSYRSI